MPTITGSGNTLSGYRWSDNVVNDVLAANGLTNKDALLEKAASFDVNSNKYLSRTELSAAAKEMATEIPAGYRWSANVLDDVLANYGLSDAKALLKAAIVLENGNKYLNKTELTAAAEELTKSEPPTGFRWSPSVLAQVMTKSGLAEENKLLQEAVKHDDGNRYLKRSELEAAAKVLTGQAQEIGIISDLDKTIIPPHSGDLPDKAYPGVVQLFHELEHRNGGQAGDTHYVTARSADRVTDIPDWLDEQGMPAGNIDTGISPLPWVAQPEKVADITRLLEANPDQKFLLFGDNSHRDPEAYRDVRETFPDRIIGVFIHRVRSVDPQRVEGMRVFEEYTEVAASLYQMGQLDEAAARRVMVAAQLQGVDITDAQIDALIADHRPA